MVGHSPWMEELAAILLGGSATSLRMDFPKSGVMGIELDRLEPGAGSCGSSCADDERSGQSSSVKRGSQPDVDPRACSG